jgi:hypothetical protein
VVGSSGLGGLALGPTLGGDRWVSRQLVEVGDDPGQHPEHTGAVERHVLRLRIGLGPQVHHDPLATVQAFQPLVAPAERLQLIREAGRNVGLTRAAPSALLTEPSGDLAGLVRTEELLDPTRTEPGGGRDPADRQPRLMGFGDGPDPLALVLL